MMMSIPRMTDGSGGDCWSRLYPALLVILKYCDRFRDFATRVVYIVV